MLRSLMIGKVKRVQRCRMRSVHRNAPVVNGDRCLPERFSNHAGTLLPRLTKMSQKLQQVIIFILLGTVFYAKTTADRNRGPKSYKGYQVIRVGITNDKVSQQVRDVFEKYNLDVWRESSSNMPSFDIMVPPSISGDVTKAVMQLGATCSTLIEDVQLLIERERGQKKGRFKRTARFFRKYHTLDEIKRWMHFFTRANRDIVKMVQVGTSYEGRRILGLKIGVPDQNVTKRIIWQDGLIHAREWITGATLIWLSRKIVTEYREGDPEITEYLQQFDWYIIPVWNVDGYKYTWRTDRMWRKSRSERGSHGCYGVDLNRNFQTPNRGESSSSDNPCSEVYHGPFAFSELESNSVRQFMLAKRMDIAALISLHSYAQYWLYPYGYTNQLSPDDKILESLSREAVDAMQKRHGTPYKHGTVSKLAYPVSGGSIDWSYQALCVKYTFAVELRDKGHHGFLLPPSLIVPTAEEYYEGLKVVARHVLHATVEDQRSAFCTYSSDDD